MLDCSFFPDENIVEKIEEVEEHFEESSAYNASPVVSNQEPDWGQQVDFLDFSFVVSVPKDGISRDDEIDCVFEDVEAPVEFYEYQDCHKVGEEAVNSVEGVLWVESEFSSGPACQYLEAHEHEEAEEEEDEDGDEDQDHVV